MSRRTHCRQRRGAAVVAMVITLLLLGLIMIGMVVGGARDQDLTAQRATLVEAGCIVPPTAGRAALAAAALASRRPDLVGEPLS